MADGAGTLARHAQDIAIRAARQADLTGRHLADTLPGAGQQLGDVLAGVRQRASDSVSQAALLSR